MHAARRAPIAAVLAVLLAAAAAGPAHADSTSPSVTGDYIGSVLAPGTTGKTVGYSVQGNAYSSTTITGLTVTYDVSGIAGIATLTPQTGICTTSGPLITCAENDLTIGSFTSLATEGWTGSEQLPLTLAPAAGATAGANGAVSVTVSGDGTAVSSPATISVSLADGPDLVVQGATGGNAATAAVAPGSTYTHTLTFTNDGDQAADGVTVLIESNGHGVDVPESRSNCEYSAPTTAYCYIPDLIAPGATETLAPVVKVLTSSDLMWQGLTIQVEPGYQGLGTYTVGAGKAFALTDSTGAAQVTVTGHATQSNIDYGDNTIGIRANTTLAADVTGYANFFPWQVSGQYLGSAYITNTGPGFVELGRSANWELTGDFTVPAGVDVVSVPSDWAPVVDGRGDFNRYGQPGYQEYWFNGGIEMGAGGQSLSGSGNLILQPEAGYPGGTGTLTVGVNQLPATDYTLFGTLDSNPANDTVTFDIPAA
jgi:hypothetical protein